MHLTFDQVLEVGVLIAEATVAVVLTPELLRHNAERRDRRARINLNLEVLNPLRDTKPVFGFDKLLADLDDVIDRAKNPAAYTSLKTGNEILICGSAEWGKKTLALHIAQKAEIGRAIIVHDPSDPDVLARAKDIIEDKQSSWKQLSRHLTTRAPKKTLLLLPDLDYVSAPGRREAWPARLEALIETASNMPHVLVVGTSETYNNDDEVSNWFGMVLSLPQELHEKKKMLRHVAAGYVDNALKEKYTFNESGHTAVIDKITEAAKTPAEIEDILVQCKTAALYRQRQDFEHNRAITTDILETAIRRVIPPEIASPTIAP